MSLKSKLLSSFFLVLLIAGNVSAAIGDSKDYYIFDLADPLNGRISHAEVIGTEIIGAQEYSQIGQWDWRSVGSFDLLYMRYSESAAFYYSGQSEKMSWQVDVPIQTTWNVIVDEDGLPPGHIEKTIVNITEVAFSYGTFSDAYVHQNRYYSDDGQMVSRVWYDYIVPDVGNVMTIDYRTANAPTIKRMIGVNVVPEPISYILFVSGGMLLAARSYLKKQI